MGSTPDTEDRIRDAAIGEFARHGFDRATVRGVAEAAGVSAGLVIHYFGSKDGLRSACDRRVADLIRSRKEGVARQGPQLDPLAALRAAQDGPPLLRYLARALTEDSAAAAELFDTMVDDAVGYLGLMEEHGQLRPSDDPRGRAAVLCAWSLGALALHRHVERVLGVDLAAAEPDPVGFLAYSMPAMEILGPGLMAPEFRHRVERALREARVDPGGRDRAGDEGDASEEATTTEERHG